MPREHQVVLTSGDQADAPPCRRSKLFCLFLLKITQLFQEVMRSLSYLVLLLALPEALLPALTGRNTNTFPFGLDP